MIDNAGSQPLEGGMVAVGEPAKVSRRPVWLAGLLMAGFTLSHLIARDLFWIWIFGAVVTLAIWFRWRMKTDLFRPRSGAAIMMGLAVIFLAAARMEVHVHRVASNDLAGYVDIKERLWRLEGRISTEPVVRTVGGGSMSRFGYQGPTTFFRFRVERAIDIDGNEINVTGRALVRLNFPEYRYRVGDELRALGMLALFPSAANPGEMDRAALARVQGLAGVLEVDSRGNVKHLGYKPGTFWALRRWQAGLRREASGWIRRDLPPTKDTRREAPRSTACRAFVG